MKMNRKRLMAFILVIAMLLSTGLPALAAETEDDLDWETQVDEREPETAEDEGEEIEEDGEPSEAEEHAEPVVEEVDSVFDAEVMEIGDAVEVSTFTEFSDAIKAGTPVKLIQDITATADIGTEKASGAINDNIEIYGNGHTLNMESYVFFLQGTHDLYVEDLTLTQNSHKNTTAETAGYGVFCTAVKGARWSASFDKFTFEGRALLGGNERMSSDYYFVDANFHDTSISLNDMYRAHSAIVYAENIYLSGKFTMTNEDVVYSNGDVATSSSAQSYFLSPTSDTTSGSTERTSTTESTYASGGVFRVAKDAEVTMLRIPGYNSSINPVGASNTYYKSLIYGYKEFIFETDSYFSATAGTSQYDAATHEARRTAVIRSNDASLFEVQDGAEVYLEATRASTSKEGTGFTALALRKSSNTKLEINVGAEALLDVKADGSDGTSKLPKRSQGPVILWGPGASTTTIDGGHLNVESNTANAWYYEYRTSSSGKVEFTVTNGGRVDIIAKNNGQKGAKEYAAFEAYGKYDVDITVENGSEMVVFSNGYRGMSLASSGGYNNKSITVDGDSQLDITGYVWAIAAETQPTLGITATNGGVINLHSTNTDPANDEEGDADENSYASSTVYSVGPTTYAVDGPGSEINVVHDGGKYSAIFHDGYGALEILITNGGYMYVENHNHGSTNAQRNAARAAICAQSTTSGSHGEANNIIDISGEGSTLYVENHNTWVHTGTATENGRYSTGAIAMCNVSGVYGWLNVSDGGNLYAISSSRTPTIYLQYGTINLDNPGEVLIMNRSLDTGEWATAPENNTSSNTPVTGMAVYNNRHNSGINSIHADTQETINFVNCDVTVWDSFGWIGDHSAPDTYEYPDEEIVDSWKNVTFSAKIGRTDTVPATGVKDTDQFTVMNYGKIYAQGYTSKKYVSEDSDAGVDGAHVYVGDEITYDIRYVNNRDEGATLTIVDHLPEGVEFVDTGDIKGVYDGTAHTVTWEEIDVPAADETTGASASGVVQVTVRVLHSVGSKVTNNAELDWVFDDADPEDDRVTQKVSVTNPVGSRKVISDSSASGKDGKAVMPGDEIAFDIYYVNPHETASDVTITDELDSSLEYVSSTDQNGKVRTDYTPTGSAVEWTIDDVEPGEGGMVSLTVRVADSATGTINNTAEISWSEDPGGPESPGIDIPVGTASYKTVAGDSEASQGGGLVHVGDRITYEIVYINNTGQTADLTIVDNLNPGLEYVGVPDGEINGPDVSANGRTLTWEVKNVAAGSSGSVRVILEVTDDAGDTVVNDADLTWYAAGGDRELDREKPGATNPVGSRKRVASGSAAGVGGRPVAPGEEITYEIAYLNTYGQTGDVVITDTLPSDVTFISCSDENGSEISGYDSYYDSGIHTITWKIGGVAPGAGGSVYVTVRVNDTVSGDIYNEATLAWTLEDDTEPEPEEPGVENPVSSHKTVADGSPGAGGELVEVGDEITYDIVYINQTGDTADLKIADTLPVGLTYVGEPDAQAKAARTTDGEGREVLTWTLTGIAGGETGKVSVTLRVTDEVGPTVTNRAVLTWSATDDGGELDTEEPEVVNPVRSKKVVSVDSEAGQGGQLVHVGDQITYEIGYVNNNTVAASLVITDTLPAGAEYVRSEPEAVESRDSQGRTVLTWTVGRVASGGNGSVFVTVEVTDEADTALVNTADLAWSLDGGGSETEKPSEENPVGSKKYVVADSAAGYGGEAVTPGDKITYSIDYVNHRDEAAKLTIVDKLPEGVEFLSAEPSPVYNVTDGELTWVLDVGANETGSVTVTVQVLESVEAEVVNTAHLTWDYTKDGGEPDIDEEDPGVTNPVESYKIVSVDSENGHSGQAVKPGDQVTYRIGYVNNTGETATLTIRDEFQKGVKFISCDASEVIKETDEGGEVVALTLTIDDVEPGGTDSILVTVEITDEADDKIVNGAELTWETVGGEKETEDPEVENPTGSSKVLIENGAVRTTPVAIGETITYQVNYVNTYGQDAYLTITDTLSDALEYVGGGDSYADGVVTWDVGVVPDGGSGHVSLTATVTESAGLQIINEAELDWKTDDSGKPGEDLDTEEPKVETPVSSSKVVAADSEAGAEGEPVYIGDRITYQINYVNTYGREGNVTITDELPAGVRYVSSEPEGAYSRDDDGTETVTWALWGVEAGESGWVKVTVEVTSDIGQDGRNVLVNGANLDWVLEDDESGDNEKNEQPEKELPIGSRKIVSGDAGRNNGVVITEQEMEYEITYVNNTGKRANVEIIDYLPDTDAVRVIDDGGGSHTIGEDGSQTITWSFADVAPGASGSVKVIVEVIAAPPAENSAEKVTLENNVRMNWETLDDSGNPDGGGETEEPPGTENNVVSGSSKYVSMDSAAGRDESMVYVGDYITYEVFYYNKDEDVTYDLVLVDTLPYGLEYVEHTDTASHTTVGSEVGFEEESDRETVTWCISGVGPLESGSVTVTALVTDAVGEETGDTAVKIVNEAALYWFDVGYVEDNYDDVNGWEGSLENPKVKEDPTSELPVGSIKVVSEHTSLEGADMLGQPVEPGDLLTYTISFYNDNEGDPAGLSDLIIEDTLAEGLDYVEHTDPDGQWEVESNYVRATHTVTWEIKGLEKGDSGSVEIVVRVNDKVGVKVSNTALLTWTPGDDTQNPSIDYPAASKKVVQAGSPGENGTGVSVGDQITYELSYVNNTGETADVTVVDELPVGVRYVDHSNRTNSTVTFDDEDRATITWTFEGIIAGAGDLLTVTVEVTEEALDMEEIVNQSTVTWTGSGDETVEEPSVTTPLASRKYAANGDGKEIDAIHVGEEVTYVIKYVNTTGYDADLTITDKLADGLAYVRHDGDERVTSSQYTDGTVTWTIEDVPAGGRGQVSVTVLVTDEVGMEVTNEAGLKWTYSDENDDPGEETEEPDVTNPVGSRKTVAGIKRADSVSGATDAVYVGDKITYQIDYVNNTGVAADVIIRDILPPDVRYVSSSDAGSYDEETHTVEWRISGVPANATGEVTVTVQVTEDMSTEIVNQAQVSWYPYGKVPSDGSDPDDGDQIGDTETPKVVNPGGSKKIIGSSSLGFVVLPGEEFTYAITYVNNYGKTASVEIVDKLPDLVKYVQHTDEKGDVLTDITNNTVTWKIEDVEPGGSGTVTVTVRVNDDASGNISNGVTLNWSLNGGEEEETPPAVEIPVGDESAKIVASDSTAGKNGARVYVGDQVTYDIIYINPNDEPADVVITDKLPTGTKYVSHSGGEGIEAGYENGTVTWKISGVEANGVGMVSVTVEITEDAEWEIVNEAELTWYIPDSDTEIGSPENPTESNPLGSKKVVESIGDSAGSKDTEVTIGDKITYAITYYNHNSVAADVVITDTLAGGVEYVSHEDENGNSLSSGHANGVVTWSIKGVPAGESGTVRVTVRVTEDALGSNTIVNRVNLKWTASDSGEDLEYPGEENPWTENPFEHPGYYNVVYSAGDGVGGDRTYEEVVGFDHKVRAHTDSELGYYRANSQFIGWAYNGTIVQAEAAVGRDTPKGETIRLVAQWRDDEIDPGTYTVRYEPGEGDGTAYAVSVTVGETHAVLNNSNANLQYTRGGYTFNGWTIGGRPVAAGTSVGGDAEDGDVITIVAAWERESEQEPDPVTDVTVTYHWNDGRADDVYATETLTPGETATAPEDPERSGYIFDGWALDTDGETAYDFSTPVTEDVHLYAVWKALMTTEHYAYLIGSDGEDGQRYVRPEDNITRGEVATILFRLMDDSYREEMWSQQNSYSDVANTEADWYNNAVSTVSRTGWFQGYEDGTFLPKQDISRAEYAQVIARLMNVEYEGPDLFDDIDDNHDWARNAINAVAENGWVQGDGDGKFRPGDKITRAEVAALMNRVLNRQPEDESDLLENMTVFPDNSDTSEWYYLDIQEASNTHAYEMKSDGVHEYWTAIKENRNWVLLEKPDSNPWDIY